MMVNDNWRSSQQAEIHASTLAPTDDREPAIVATLAPGNYTAVVRGTGDYDRYCLDRNVRSRSAAAG